VEKRTCRALWIIDSYGDVYCDASGYVQLLRIAWRDGRRGVEDGKEGTEKEQNGGFHGRGLCGSLEVRSVV
jgi:hypothetical protein